MLEPSKFLNMLFKTIVLSIGIICTVYYWYLSKKGIVLGVFNLPFYSFKEIAYFLLSFLAVLAIFEFLITTVLHKHITIEKDKKLTVDCDENTKYILLLSSSSIARINSMIEKETIKASMNLIYGLIIALLGFIFIGYFLLNFEYDKYNGSLIKFAIDFIPKISVTLIIETFALFFLKLYSSGLKNIIALQDKATDIEFKMLSYQSAMLSNNETLKETIIKSYSEFK